MPTFNEKPSPNALALKQAQRALHGQGTYAGGCFDRAAFDQAFIFWRGTSGHEYVHTIYSLSGCPEIPSASVMLVGRTETGFRRVLKVFSVEHPQPSLNLAQVRQAGATLGATEVHLHFALGPSNAVQIAAFDLQMQHCNRNIPGAE